MAEDDDIAVLYPEREADIAGRHVVMREYGFLEGMRLAARVDPLITALIKAWRSNQRTALKALRAAIGMDPDGTAALVAQACDQPVAWVQGLSDADGQQLLALWWTVNSGFFMRRVVLEIQVEQAATALAGAASTPPSSATATTRGSSGATPRAN